MSWQELLKDNITKASDLTEYLQLTKEEQKKMEEILDRYPISVPKYYLSLIDFNDENDPIKKMCIPSIYETDMSGSFDTSGESTNTVIQGAQHKYKQTVLVLSTSVCAMYCRHCFRKRFVGASDDEVLRQVDELVTYVKEHEEVTSVLISGGDAFLNSNQVLERYLKGLSEIEHLDIIRIGTRTPVVLPQRISTDPGLQEILKKYGAKKKIYLATQFNHPNEMTKEAREAIDILKECGVELKNQTVLLKGINDSKEALGTLLKELTKWGIAPYYIFQCRPVTGVKNQFQLPLEEGYRIVEEAKSMQNGIGKSVRYALSHETGKIEIVGMGPDDQMIFKYHQAKAPENQARIFQVKLEEGQAWL